MGLHRSFKGLAHDTYPQIIASYINRILVAELTFQRVWREIGIQMSRLVGRKIDARAAKTRDILNLGDRSQFVDPTTGEVILLGNSSKFAFCPIFGWAGPELIWIIIDESRGRRPGPVK
jgi:hypothetical protein